MVSGSCAASGHMWKRKGSVRAQLSGDVTLRMLQRHQSPLAVPEGVGAAGSGSHNSKPPSPTQASKLLDLQLGLGKDGLSKGSWRLLLTGLFLFFCSPSVKKSQTGISSLFTWGLAVSFPAPQIFKWAPIPVLSSLSQGQSWELPSGELNSKLPQK